MNQRMKWKNKINSKIILFIVEFSNVYRVLFFVNYSIAIKQLGKIELNIFLVYEICIYQIYWNINFNGKRTFLFYRK